MWCFSREGDRGLISIDELSGSGLIIFQDGDEGLAAAEFSPDKKYGIASEE